VVIIIANLIRLITNLIVLAVIVDSVLSYFLSPYHPIRHALDRILSPMLAPIRRIIPLVGMFDLSPLILIILVEILSSVLIRFLYIL